jgi:hypothetical protein
MTNTEKPDVEKIVNELMERSAKYGSARTGNSKKRAEEVRDKLLRAIDSESKIDFSALRPCDAPVSKHEGVSSNRTPREPKEKAFADVWAEQAPTTLPYLLYGQDRRNHALSQKDATVAATVIQWLGSNVGQSFLEDVKERIERYKSDPVGSIDDEENANWLHGKK